MVATLITPMRPAGRGEEAEVFRIDPDYHYERYAGQLDLPQLWNP